MSKKNKTYKKDVGRVRLAELSEQQRCAIFALKVGVENAAQALDISIAEMRSLIKTSQLPVFKGSFGGTPYPDKIKQKALEKWVKGEVPSSIFKELYINRATLIYWIVQYKRLKGLPVRLFADIKTQEKIAKKARKASSIKEFRKQNKVKTSRPNLCRWIKKYEHRNKVKPLIVNTRRMTPALRNKIAKHALKHGVKKTSEKFDIKVRNIWGWVRIYKREKGETLYKKPFYTKQQKDKAIKLAQKIGRDKASKKLGMAPYSIYRWDKKSG